MTQPLPADLLQRSDPRGLIREAYRIEGITTEECRSIFFDWAMGRKEGEGDPVAAAALLDHYGGTAPEHPMTAVLAEIARAPLSAPRRGRRRLSRREAEDGE